MNQSTYMLIYRWPQLSKSSQQKYREIRRLLFRQIFDTTNALSNFASDAAITSADIFRSILVYRPLI